MAQATLSKGIVMGDVPELNPEALRDLYDTKSALDKTLERVRELEAERDRTHKCIREIAQDSERRMVPFVLRTIQEGFPEAFVTPDASTKGGA